jgi:ribosomal protein L11 methylase PrmA
LEITKPISVIDLGANTGKFSFIAAEYAERVIALEADDNCVDTIEKQILANNISNIVAIVGNLNEPSPNLGLLNNETKNIYERANSEMVFALALTHHLFFTNRISFNQIATVLNKLSNKYLIVEFIDIADKKVQELIVNNYTNQEDYTETNFIESLAKYFKILEIKKLQNSNRSLLFMEKQLSA